jgi:hypothetical protein
MSPGDATRTAAPVASEHDADTGVGVAVGATRQKALARPKGLEPLTLRSVV